MRKWIYVMAVLLPLLAVADPAAEKGLAIVKEMDQRNTGWGDSQATMRMILVGKDGQKSVRKIRVMSLEGHGDGDKSLTIFDEPFDVKGTAFLSYSHSLKPDEQWLYLPALKRVKRISSNNKSGPFMGSEFAYEDIASFEVDKYTYRFLGEDELDGEKMFMVEMKPRYEHSGYTREVAWIDQSEYRMRKIDFYDRKNSLLKTLTFSDYKQYLGKFWRAHKMEMVNHQKGKKTILEWLDYRFNTGLTEDDFKVSVLKRAR
jgi:outer membrane lipoprotein-sorting protein